MILSLSSVKMFTEMIDLKILQCDGRREEREITASGWKVQCRIVAFLVSAAGPGKKKGPDVIRPHVLGILGRPSYGPAL